MNITIDPVVFQRALERLRTDMKRFAKEEIKRQGRAMLHDWVDELNRREREQKVKP